MTLRERLASPAPERFGHLVIGALVVALCDATRYVALGGGSARAALGAALFVGALLAFLGLGATVVCFVARRVERIASEGAWAGIACVPPLLLHLYVTAFASGGRPLTVILSFSLGCGLLIVMTQLAKRLTGLGFAWVLGTVLGSVGAYFVVTNNYYLGKVEDSGLGMYFAAVHALPWVALVDSLCLATIFGPKRRGKTTRRIGVLAMAAGAALVFVVLGRLPLFSDPEVMLAIASGLLLVSAGATTLDVPRHDVFVFVGCGLVVAQLFVGGLSMPSSISRWSVARRTVVASWASTLLDAGTWSDDPTARTFRVQNTYGLALGRQGEPRAEVVVAGARPNILLVTVDSLRYDAIQRGITPNIDALAGRSTVYERAYTQGGWTSIAMPAISWSKHPRHVLFSPLFEDTDHELHMAGEVPDGARVRRRFQTPINETDPDLATALGVGGYRSVAIANDGFTGYFEPALGFFEGFDDVIHPEDQAPADEPLDEVTADLVVETLAEVGTEPLFVWAHLFGPHGPYEPPMDRDVPYEGYDGEVFFADLQIGRMIESLAWLENAEDTIIIVTADHGESFGEHYATHHGTELYDHAVRVPLVVHMPGQRTASRDDTPVGLIDIAPTVLSHVGLSVPNTMAGTVLGSGRRGPVFIETWKYWGQTERFSIHLVAVVFRGHKLIVDVRRRGFALFDLEADANERTDLLERDGLSGLDSETREIALSLGGHAMTYIDSDFRSGGAAAQ